MNKPKGVFQAIDSFAIRSRKQFYIIGNLSEGHAEKNWFVNIPFNTSIGMTVRIFGIEEIETSAKKEKHTLLIVDCGDEGMVDLLLGLNIGLEELEITINGTD